MQHMEVMALRIQRIDRPLAGGTVRRCAVENALIIQNKAGGRGIGILCIWVEGVQDPGVTAGGVYPKDGAVAERAAIGAAIGGRSIEMPLTVQEKTGKRAESISPGESVKYLELTTRCVYFENRAVVVGAPSRIGRAVEEAVR